MELKLSTLLFENIIPAANHMGIINNQVEKPHICTNLFFDRKEFISFLTCLLQIRMSAIAGGTNTITMLGRISSGVRY